MENLLHSYEVGIKRLSEVEASRDASNQHELNGVAGLRAVLGEATLTQVPCRWLRLRDDGDAVESVHRLTWYDAREAHESRTEWRLYFSGDPKTSAGDLLAVIKRSSDDGLAIVVAPKGSSWDNQLVALFDEPSAKSGAFAHFRLSAVRQELAGVAESLFDQLGWLERAAQPDEDDLQRLIATFGKAFPSTQEFSEFARERSGVDASDGDEAISAWWRKEERLFLALEDMELRTRLDTNRPFSDVADFLGYSLSVQNRRKSRAGRALENHVEALMRMRGIRFSRGAATEGSRRPDFLLPGAREYHDGTFPADLLSMLAVKTTCKDRWRQVLDEAVRIPSKHLLTIEPAISTDQLSQMFDASVCLVVQRQIVSTYRPPSGMHILSIEDFLRNMTARQARMPG